MKYWHFTLYHFVYWKLECSKYSYYIILCYFACPLLAIQTLPIISCGCTNKFVPSRKLELTPYFPNWLVKLVLHWLSFRHLFLDSPALDVLFHFRITFITSFHFFSQFLPGRNVIFENYNGYRFHGWGEPTCMIYGCLAASLGGMQGNNGPDA